MCQHKKINNRMACGASALWDWRFTCLRDAKMINEVSVVHQKFLAGKEKRSRRWSYFAGGMNGSDREPSSLGPRLRACSYCQPLGGAFPQCRAQTLYSYS